MPDPTELTKTSKIKYELSSSCFTGLELHTTARQKQASEQVELNY